ncbi:hypothetical protein P7C71_g6534, partial [Lecanoromycetidae sp. Uapishka_2]
MRIFSVVRILVTLCLASRIGCVAITGPTGGVNAATGQRPFRQDFSTFKTSGPAFDLYILSLQQFQQQNQTAQLSYYSVSGRSRCQFGSDKTTLGQFAKQILWSNARQIAATYPASQRSIYQAAARTLRIPYWDWALNVTMPDPVNDPMISVNTPSGMLNIVNPLYNYTFHPQPSTVDFPPQDSLSKYHSTVRYPNAAGQSQPDLANAQLQANAPVFLVQTYLLIADQDDYAPFSNTQSADGRGNAYNSIENMHNGIHLLVGNGGHMAIIPFSAFDPIFWLHHANVDRLLAIWQAIHPDSYTTPEVNTVGTQTIAPGTIDDINSPLTPFHSDNAGTLYTSATVRSTRTFGYTYPEVIDWNVNATQLSSNVRANVNKLYNPTGSISQTKPRSLKPRLSNATHSYPYMNSTTTDYQYFVNIRLDKYVPSPYLSLLLPNLSSSFPTSPPPTDEPILMYIRRSSLSCPFFIHFFLGPPPPSPQTWPSAPNLIASHSVLYYPSTSTSLNTTAANTAYGQIPLNHALVSRIVDLH